MAKGITFNSAELGVEVDDAGMVVELADLDDSLDYVYGREPSPLLMARIGGEFRLPKTARSTDDGKGIVIDYGEVQIALAVDAKPTHIVFEIVRVEPDNVVDRVQWGPLATRIGDTVGEVVGVVRNQKFSIGLQVLNVKTLGGPSPNEEGLDTSRGRTAMKTEWGSTLQAYTIDRSRPRRLDVWGGQFPDMPVPPIPGETLVGSKIALFGCPPEQALDRIGEIELAEGLPHPLFRGKWIKKSPELGRSYLIADFSEGTVDELLDYAERGNFLSLYHGSPFKSWGHYELSPHFFPNGEKGMRDCVEKAKARGILIGVHTLSNFINTNDPYITPVPDPRLAKTGSSFLTAAVDDSQTDIEVASPKYFATDANWLRTVVIGEELVRYGKVSETEPWILSDCQRGAFDTKVSAHSEGAEVAKLMDHPYRVFFPNYEMQHDIAVRLAELFNKTGIGHFDFDGHEGCWSSGQGDFGIVSFANTVHEHLDSFVHNGTSNSKPFYWHINSVCNWGEPWYGGFRSSMAEYRINNQAMLERNYMPKMLGWFLLTPTTTLADIEWLMARSAGYNSGFALATSLDSLRANPGTGVYLDAIRNWENLRMVGAFSAEQMERMRDTENEFHLKQISSTEFMLHQYVKSEEFEYKSYIRQPGEPTGTVWSYKSVGAKQPLQFQLVLVGNGSVSDLRLEIDNYIFFEFPDAVSGDQTLLCDGSKTARIYGANGRQIKTIELPKRPPDLPPGEHEIRVQCKFKGEPAPVVKMIFKSMDKGERISF